MKQKGAWRLDVRFNTEEIVRRINLLWAYRERIDVHCMDAVRFLADVVPRSCDPKGTLIYLDPPYYTKSDCLYLNYYRHEDHLALSQFITRQLNYRWVLTYDNVDPIRQMYKHYPSVSFRLPYSARTRTTGEEVLIHDPDLRVPRLTLSS